MDDNPSMSKRTIERLLMKFQEEGLVEKGWSGEVNCLPAVFGLGNPAKTCCPLTVAFEL